LENTPLGDEFDCNSGPGVGDAAWARRRSRCFGEDNTLMVFRTVAVEIARDGTSSRRNGFLQACRVDKATGPGWSLPSGRPKAGPGGPAR